MELSDLRPGQKVRVTYEGIMQDDGFCNRGEIAVEASDGAVADYHYHVFSKAQVELVEPEYVCGAVYQDADGDLWVLDQGFRADGDPAWFSPGDSSAYDFDRPVRPLTRMVPEASSA